MKAKVDKDTCIGCGLCQSICPNVFSMDSDGLAIAINDDVPESSQDDALDAQSSCPVDAISVE